MGVGRGGIGGGVERGEGGGGGGGVEGGGWGGGGGGEEGEINQTEKDKHLKKREEDN